MKEYDASAKRGLAHVFFELNQKDIEYLKNPDYNLKTVHKLDSKIPADLRLKIVSFFNQDNSIGHLIDIDHFVPRVLVAQETSLKIWSLLDLALIDIKAIQFQEVFPSCS